MNLDGKVVSQAMKNVLRIYECRPENPEEQDTAVAIHNILKVSENFQDSGGESSKSLSDFILLLKTHFVMYTLVPKSCLSHRVILKYKISGDASNKVTDSTCKRLIRSLVAPYELDLWWDKSNHHIDVSYPTELVIDSVILGADGENFEVGQPQVHRYHTNIPANRVEEFVGKNLYFTVVPAVQSLRRWNAWLSILFGLGYALGLFIQLCVTKDFGFDAASLRSAATVVLLLPALLVSWLARSNEHPFVAVAFSQLRLVFLLQALILYFSSVILVLHVGGRVWTLSWWVIYISVGIVSVYAIYLHRRVLKNSSS